MHYFGPLLNKVKEFKETICNLRVQYRQERDARCAKRARAKSWTNRNPVESREHAAQIIQGVFRSHHVRRKTNTLRMLIRQREYLAARRLQRHFRASLQCARERIQKKREEFLSLLKEEQLHRKRGEVLEASRRTTVAHVRVTARLECECSDVDQ